MDAPEELLAILREIRDHQCRLLESLDALRAEAIQRDQVRLEAWKAASDRHQRESREDMDRQWREWNERQERIVEEERARARPYEEANRLYLKSMRWAERLRPFSIATLIIILVALAAFSVYRVVWGTSA